jgi:hypothetical protein
MLMVVAGTFFFQYEVEGEGNVDEKKLYDVREPRESE